MQVNKAQVTLQDLQEQLAQLPLDQEEERIRIQEEIQRIKKAAYSSLTAWDQVCMARDPKRPKAMDFIGCLFDDFIELHGDRLFQDDPACQCGLASFHGLPVTIIAQSKGKTLEENIYRNFGMLHPEGYRKAIRLAKQAEKFKRPIITFVDTAGAYPGKGAEERGQAEAIAKCLEVFSQLRVPVIAIVISEGGSGGALAFSVADRIFMLEHAIYSILSPEGFASILWKDEKRCEEAAQLMELTSDDLYRKQIVDQIIQEPQEGVHTNLAEVCKQLEEAIYIALEELLKKKDKVLLKERYEKFRRMGALYENV